jgi:deoxyribodipyrimidine photo-lyase
MRANFRHYRFLVEGLADLAAGLHERRVGFVLRVYPAHRLMPFLTQVRPAIVIGDENPLRQQERWRDSVANDLASPLWTVDADVVVPTALLETEQYAARTIRPRLHKHLDTFLTPSDEPTTRVAWTAPEGLATVAPDASVLNTLTIDRSVAPVDGWRGGTGEARRRLSAFVTDRLEQYGRHRNHPELSGTSELSPYLHFGHLGPREAALAVRKSGAPQAAIDASLEQLIVRRELAVNYVRFNSDYDRLAGCEPWARRTLRQHQFDRRPHLYTRDQFDAGHTHDPLWNAAQRQMASTGWMHGYMRMYWAKKILEWSADPVEAFETAIALNDRYQLDGRDPNGYANIAWAIGGKHDRPWPPRPVYGTIRSMSFASTSRKFDAAAYIDRFARR